MTTEKDTQKMFQSPLIAEKEEGGVIFILYENKIYHVIIPKFGSASMETVNSGYKFLEANGGGKFYNIFQFKSYSSIEPELRKWAAESSGNHYTHSDAIVIESFPQKIIVDFYLKINKPNKPTKMFYSLEKAVKWTLNRMKECS